ncbi:unnamed protein product, partial [Prunus brigantina]
RHGSKEKEEDCDNSSCSRVRETTFVCIHDVSNCHICFDSMVYEKYYLKNGTFVRHETCLSVLDRFIGHSDITCVNELRMNRKTFGMLCELLRTHGRLKMYGSVAIEEQVCMFLYILA